MLLRGRHRTLERDLDRQRERFLRRGDLLGEDLPPRSFLLTRLGERDLERALERDLERALERDRECRAYSWQSQLGLRPSLMSLLYLYQHKRRCFSLEKGILFFYINYNIFLFFICV